MDKVFRVDFWYSAFGRVSRIAVFDGDGHLRGRAKLGRYVVVWDVTASKVTFDCQPWIRRRPRSFDRLYRWAASIGWAPRKGDDKTSTEMADSCVLLFCIVSYAPRTASLQSMPRSRYYQLKRMQFVLANQSEDCLYLNIYIPNEGTNWNDDVGRKSPWNY